MLQIILSTFFSTIAFAGDGEGHSHDTIENVGPIVAIFAVLIVAGLAFHFRSKK